jgi:hypothetical protein
VTKLVVRLVARKDTDVVDERIVFELNAGVNFAIPTDNLPEDSTIEILESYARHGYLFLIREDTSCPGSPLNHSLGSSVDDETFKPTNSEARANGLSSLR